MGLATRSSGTICDSSCRRDSRCSTRTLSLGSPPDAAALRCRGGAEGRGRGLRSDDGVGRARRAVGDARLREELRRDACERRRRARVGFRPRRRRCTRARTFLFPMPTAGAVDAIAPASVSRPSLGAGTRDAEWRDLKTRFLKNFGRARGATREGWCQMDRLLVSAVVSSGRRTRRHAAGRFAPSRENHGDR